LKQCFLNAFYLPVSLSLSVELISAPAFKRSRQDSALPEIYQLKCYNYALKTLYTSFIELSTSTMKYLKQTHMHT